MRMCVCVCVYIYIYIYICVCVCVCVCVHTHTQSDNFSYIRYLASINYSIQKIISQYYLQIYIRKNSGNAFQGIEEHVSRLNISGGGLIVNTYPMIHILHCNSTYLITTPHLGYIIFKPLSNTCPFS